LQQQLVQQDDIHHRAVVALHELLDRERVGGIFVTEALREFDLVIEQQPVFAPAGQHVQSEADLPQERLRLFELAQLAWRQKAVREQFVERARAEWRFATQAMVWISRNPPGPVLTFGSRLYAVSFAFRWRSCCSATFASK